MHGDETAADVALADLAATVVNRESLGDLRLRELLDRFLEWFGDGTDEAQLLGRLADTVVEPAIGRRLAILLSASDVEKALSEQHSAGASGEQLAETVRLIRLAYRWAQRRRWTNRNPAVDVDLRQILGRGQG